MRKPIVDAKYSINHNGTNYYIQNLKWESDHTECGFHWVENLFNSDTNETIFDDELNKELKVKLALECNVLTHI